MKPFLSPPKVSLNPLFGTNVWCPSHLHSFRLPTSVATHSLKRMKVKYPRSSLIEAVDTTNKMWAGYLMTGFYDPAFPNGNPLQGLKYNNFPLVNCTVDIILNQYPNGPLQDSVISPVFD